VKEQKAFAENIRVHPFESLELDPTQAQRFKLMEKAMSPEAAGTVLHHGQEVPDFTLTDQHSRRVSLAQFRGKVVALTFVYTRCPRPEYCVRLSNNLGLLARRFQKGLGKDLILLTIAIDPVHDQAASLDDYAESWKVNSSSWHFLTGDLAQVREIGRRFDLNFYPDEALLVHSFHTVVIDRGGRLAANLEGNGFSSRQLGDMVATVMGLPPNSGTE